MVIYVLKSSACLATFFLFYKLFLEKENMHIFKRFYLLASLIAAYSIPLLTFTSYVLVSPNEEFSKITANDIFIGMLVEENKTDYVAIILWTVYGLGVLFFTLKFIFNLWKITDRIRKNTTHKTQPFINVLLDNLTTPHTFFNYIFLNKHQFETKQIPTEVLVHEQTHAKQKHTLDILFIELLQLVFWFNPFIYIIKHAIKLNHEFLADQSVLNQGFNTANYQKTLLKYTSSDRQISLTNAINYSFIKKRFTIMKTHTSKNAIWLRSLVLLPLLAVVIYGFSEKVTQEKLIAEIQETENNAQVKDVEIAINKSMEILINGENYATLENLAEEVNKIVSIYNSEQLKNVTAYIQADGTLKKGFIIDIKQELIKTGIVRYKQTLPFQDKATPEQLAEYNKIAKHYNAMSKNQFIVKLKEVERIRYIYNLMSLDQRRNSAPFPNFPPPPPPASIESKKDTLKNSERQKTGWVTNDEETLYYIEEKGVIKYYNRFGKRVFPGKFTSGKSSGEEFNITVLDDTFDNKETEKILQLPPKVSSKQKEGDTLEIIKEDYPQPAMTKKSSIENLKNKTSANKNGKTGWINRNGETIYYVIENGETEYYNRFGFKVDETGKVIPLPPLPKNATSKQKRKHKKLTKLHKEQGEEIVEIPPPPPTPPNPLDHIIEMAKIGAIFYHEDKKISSDKAIAIIKKNKSINIRIIDHDSKNPTVKLSKKPTTIKNK